MPCYDSTTSPEYVRAEAIKEFTHNSPVAEMLCGVLTALIATGNAVPPIDGLDEWWRDHQRRDEAKK